MEECQLINIEGMTEVENQYSATSYDNYLRERCWNRKVKGFGE